MGKQKYEVNLREQEVKKLSKMIHTGKSSAHEILHANILLAENDKGKSKLSHAKIAALYQTSAVTVQKIAKAYATNGLVVALQHKKLNLSLI